MTGTLAIVFAAVAVLVVALGLVAMARSRREADRADDGRADDGSDGLDFPAGFESFDSAEARVEREEAEGPQP